MTVAVDNSFLTLFLNPEAKVRPNPATNEPTSYLKERIQSLLDDCTSRRRKMIVPCPALAEALCVATPAHVLLEKLRQFSCIEPFPFDQKSAMSVAEIVRANVKDIQTIRKDATKPWQHMKMDLQIVGVAKAYGAEVLYTDDTTQASFASLAGLSVVHTWQLPLSDRYAQKALDI